MRLRSFTSLGIAATLAATAACSDNTGPNNTRLAGGNYDLLSVNGTGLPYSYNTGSETVTIENDVYTLNSDGSYVETINENTSSSGPITDSESGTWSQSGNTVNFYAQYSTLQAPPYQYQATLTSGGTFSHSSLTFITGGVPWVYQHE